MSEGDLSGMDSEVVEESVVAIDAVVASSKDGGVQGRRSGRPGEDPEEGLLPWKWPQTGYMDYLHNHSGTLSANLGTM